MNSKSIEVKVFEDEKEILKMKELLTLNTSFLRVLRARWTF
jgi:hypothetical protein